MAEPADDSDISNYMRCAYAVALAAAVFVGAGTYTKWMSWSEAAWFVLTGPVDTIGFSMGPAALAAALVVVGFIKPRTWWGAACGFAGVLGWAFTGVVTTGIGV